MSNRATYDLSSIRLAASAAEPLPADIYRRWRDRFGIEILDGIGQRHPCFVLATGGSLVSETGTFERLLRSCFTVWVRASPEEHMQGDMRPMANNRDAMSDLRRIVAEREVLYGKAYMQIDTSRRSLEQSVDALLQELRATPVRESLVSDR